MTDYVWPADIAPSASEWRLVANTAAFSSPLSGSTRTLARGGDRWACSLQFSNLTDSKRARLQAFLARLRGQANRCWLWDHSYRKRGTFPSGELLPNPLNASAPAWTASAYAALLVSDGVLRLTAGAHTAGQFPTATQATTVVSGGAYVGRAAIEYASSTAATFGAYINVGTAGGTSYATTLGLRRASAVSDGTSGVFGLVYDDDVVAGNYFDTSYVSMSRCALVNGGSQTGSVVAVDAIPSATDLLLPGDLVQIGDYLYMVAARFSSTDGRLHITPPLRSSPADNAPVIIHQPMARMMLSGQTVGWSNQPGGRVGAISSMTVDFVEDLVG